MKKKIGDGIQIESVHKRTHTHNSVGKKRNIKHLSDTNFTQNISIPIDMKCRVSIMAMLLTILFTSHVIVG